MAEHICNLCAHEQACAAWIRHCAALYDDFVYSTDNCPYFDVVPNRWEHEHNEYDETKHTCPVCGFYKYTDSDIPLGYKFCPQCGVPMKS